MADKKELKKNNNKGKSKGISAFFADLKAELKRVNWPDRIKLERTAFAVVILSVIFTILIWVVDTLISGGFSYIGMHHKDAVNNANKAVPATTQVATQPTAAPSTTTVAATGE